MMGKVNGLFLVQSSTNASRLFFFPLSNIRHKCKQNCGVTKGVPTSAQELDSCKSAAFFHVSGVHWCTQWIDHVLGQSSLASTAWLSYADPKISLLTKNVGPTSGELRLRIDGTNFAILDNSVQKYISWFNGHLVFQ